MTGRTARCIWIRLCPALTPTHALNRRTSQLGTLSFATFPKLRIEVRGQKTGFGTSSG